MKKIILILIVAPLFSQAQSLEWARQIGGTNIDACFSIVTDKSENVYATGMFTGTIDFDPGPGIYTLTSTGSQDIFIEKMDDSGNFLWAVSLGSINTDYGKSITIDADNNIYITGWFYETIDFDPGTGIYNLTSLNQGNAFILKLNASGDFIWAKSISCDTFSEGKDITIGKSKNVYICGTFLGTADFDPGAGSFIAEEPGEKSAFILKLDADGNFLFAKIINATKQDDMRSIFLDDAENIYTTGNFDETVDFDPGAGTYTVECIGADGMFDVFILKLDEDGNFIWVKIFGGDNQKYGTAIAVDDSLNIYTTGSFWGTVDFDPGTGEYILTSSGGNDIFVSKLDQEGNFLWTHSFGSASSDYGASINLHSGKICVGGMFQETIDFDGSDSVYTLTSHGSEDIFILNLDQAGHFTNVMGIGGTSVDEALSITTAESGALYAGGIFSTIVDFDPSVAIFELEAAGIYDAAILKLNNSPVPIEEVSGKDVEILIYPNPADSEIKIKCTHAVNSMHYTLTNIQGDVILSGEIQAAISSLDIQNIGDGYYFLHIGEFYAKIMKISG